MTTSVFHPNQLIAQGRYRIDRLLGEGGMGAVYEATELALERKVALKVLLPELSQHPTARQRMEAEAKAMARLNSPHVVRVNTVFDEGGLLVIDLEFMAGGSLADKLDGRGVDEATARDWISQILKGLEALHRVGLVHRDLKPANVLLDENGVLKVTDLGIAQDSQRTGGLKTRHDANLGTPEYMAPEQVQSAATVDARADVYAAGVMLYEFLTGRVPFSGEDWAVKAAHVQRAPDLAPVSERSSALAPLVERALSKAADSRFASAAEMSKSLSEIPLAHRSGSSPSPVSELRLPAWPAEVAVDSVAPLSKVGSREHAGLGPAGLAVVITVIVVLILAFASTLPSSAQTKLIGKWGIDVEKLGDMEEIKKMPADQREKAIEMAKSFAGSMAFEFTGTSMIMEAMGQRKEGTYKVIKSEGDTLTIEATLDGKTETLQAEIKGDGVVLGKDKAKFTLKRK